MTREKVAAKIRWQTIIWLFGFLNITAMLPQFWQLVTTRKTEGLSLPMFLIYLSVQVAFSLDGYFKRNKTLFICLGISAIITLANIIIILVLRHG